MATKWITKKGRYGENRHIPIMERKRKIREREILLQMPEHPQLEKERVRESKSEKTKMMVVGLFLKKCGTSVEKLKKKLASEVILSDKSEAEALLVAVNWNKKAIDTALSDTLSRFSIVNWEYKEFTYQFSVYSHNETTTKALMEGSDGYFLSEFNEFLDTLYYWIIEPENAD